MSERQAGFSLVELLVAILIIGVLAVVVVMSVGKSNVNAPKTCEADAQALRTAGAAYYAANANTFAADVATLKQSGFLRSDPPLKPAAGPITDADAPHGYALELQPMTDEPLVHAWGVDKAWGTGDDRVGGASICTEGASGL